MLSEVENYILFEKKFPEMHWSPVINGVKQVTVWPELGFVRHIGCKVKGAQKKSIVRWIQNQA